MAKTKPIAGDPRVDKYIADAPAWAQPILRRLRESVHRGCPGVEESMKWSRPFFSSGGRPLCNMSAFTAHCSFGFWHTDLANLILMERGPQEESAGQFGRITTLKDLPDAATLVGYVEEGVRLNASGKSARPSTTVSVKKPEITAPAEFAALLMTTPGAQRVFDAFSPSQRREYLEWITEAKQEATRAKRTATAIEWIAEGKKRHWKYENC